ncbi:MAG: desulfoferrodoxin, partial [Clostridia bacterium]
MTFYICRHCGNIIAYAENKGVPVVCCGEKMQALVPGVVEASHEKHVPVMVKEENHITV